MINGFVKDGRQKDMYSIMKEGTALIKEGDSMRAETRKQEQQPTQFALNATNKTEDTYYIKRARIFDDEKTKQALEEVTHQIESMRAKEEHDAKM